MSETTAIVAHVQSIGTIPTAVAQVCAMVNDPKATAHDFERVVRPDMGLTANLLKCANSAYYRGTREITSVRDAISRMGLRRVFEVAAGASFARAIPRELVGYGLSSDEYWGHAVATAVLADHLGRRAGFTYPDLAFTAGLLHDLGKVVVASWLLQSRAGAAVPSLSTVEDEQELLGTDHAQLGEALAVKWNMPQEISGAARWHHNSAGAPTATLRYLSTVVELSDHAAAALGYGDGPRAEAESTWGTSAFERLDLEEDEVRSIIEKAGPEIVRTRELLASAR